MVLNRRNFLKLGFQLGAACLLPTTWLHTSDPTAPIVVYKGFACNGGYVYAPYIPLTITDIDRSTIERYVADKWCIPID